MQFPLLLMPKVLHCARPFSIVLWLHSAKTQTCICCVYRLLYCSWSNYPVLKCIFPAAGIGPHGHLNLCSACTASLPMQLLQVQMDT